MNLEQIIEQLEWCFGEHEGGPLENNTAWVELKRLLAGDLGLKGAREILDRLTKSYPPDSERTHGITVNDDGDLLITLACGGVWQALTFTDDDLLKPVGDMMVEVEQLLFDAHGWTPVDGGVE